MTRPLGEVLAVDDVAAAFVEVVNRAAPTTLVLSGGSTARHCYEHLRDRGTLDWPRTEVLLGDERFVPLDSPDSNEGMVRAALTDHVPVAALYSMARAGTTPADAAANYETVVRGVPAGLHVVHLGVGSDGHTASLFPGSPALDERDRFVVATGDDVHQHPRITLTFPAIATARLVVVTIAGEEKRDAWLGITAGDERLPATRIRAATVVWIVDRALAA